MSGPTGYASFTAAIAVLSPTGVVRKYTSPPASLSDFPCSWVQLAEGDETPLTFDGGGGWPVLRAQYVVAIVPVSQGTMQQNWNDTISMMDAVSVALRAAPPGSIGKQKVSWRIRAGSVRVGDADYWAVIADIVGNG
jgi:hypothetical protein